jgi:hypothetical protein
MWSKSRVSYGIGHFIKAVSATGQPFDLPDKNSRGHDASSPYRSKIYKQKSKTALLLFCLITEELPKIENLKSMRK